MSNANQSVLSKKCENVCLCKRHKTELKRLLDETYLSESTQGKRLIDAQHRQENSPEEQTVELFSKHHRVKASCKSCIHIYLHLLTAPCEQISEVYLKSAYQKCYHSTNTQ